MESFQRLSVSVFTCFLTAGALVSLDVAAQDQNERGELLLPHAAHVMGIVVGEDGKPVPHAFISPAYGSRTSMSDAEGNFDLTTSSPNFVIRKPGFQGVLLRTESSTGVRVVLRRSERSADYPTCSPGDGGNKIEGWGGVFQFPKLSDVRASSEAFDVDFWQREYSAVSGNQKIEIIHGRGVMWGGGEPSDVQVWRSIRYTETTYDLGGRLIIDAKGWLPNGKCWRSLGLTGESAYYDNVECELAKPLDNLLDRGCLIPNASKRAFP